VKISAKSQVAIPLDVREKVGLLPGNEVEFTIVSDGVKFRLKRDQANKRGEALIAKLKGRATVRMSADEIMRLTREEP